MTLSDGSSFFVLKEVQLSQGLYPGVVVDAREQERLQRLSRHRAAIAAALGLLSRAPHTRAGLRLKLLKRDHDEEAIAAALERAQDLGLLDDARFAEEWISLRLDRHPEGRAALVADLRERGVARDVAEQVVSRMVSAEVEEQALLRALRRGRRAGRIDSRRLASRLRALGFPDRLIRKHLRDGAEPIDS